MDPNQPRPQLGQLNPDPGYTNGQPGYSSQVPFSSSPFVPPEVPKKNRLPWIIAGALIGLLTISIIIVVLLGGDKQPSTLKPKNIKSEATAQAMQPATAIGTEEASNSISQDISGLSDDTDFPANRLDDRTLGL